MINCHGLGDGLQTEVAGQSVIKEQVVCYSIIITVLNTACSQLKAIAPKKPQISFVT